MSRWTIDDTRTRRAALVSAAVAVVLALVWTLWPDAATPRAVIPPPPPQEVVAGTVLKPPPVCGDPATRPFKPTRITIRNVARDAEVLALPRDANKVPQAPAISTLGKTQFGWDDAALTPASGFDSVKPPGAVPGSDHGNVLMNAHTWPDGTAMGNHLLDNLQEGDRIILRGKHAELCYKVTKRVVIKAADGSHEYYDQDGPPQLALIVCSPPRLGPGNWENRTLWFASPIIPEGAAS